jgi:peptide/nickel transport system permease protein
MIPVITKRLLAIIPTLLIGLTITFLVLHLAPGDPTIRFLEQSQSREAQVLLKERFGLNEPIVIQYLKWLRQVVLHFDFGFSFYNGKPSSNIIIGALKPTVLLSFFALLFALLVGISGGVTAALKRQSRYDQVIHTIFIILLATPTFWLGLMAMGIFSIKLGWLPGSHWHSLYHQQLHFLARLGDSFRHLLLPVVTLGLPLAATIFKYIRSGMITALQSDYVLGAKARGVSQTTILWKYTLKNTLLPVVSLLGVIVPALLSGAIVVEVIYALPGVGRTMVNAVFSRDYPVLMAGSTAAFLIVLFSNLITDISYFFIDPRILTKKDLHR